MRKLKVSSEILSKCLLSIQRRKKVCIHVYVTGSPCYSVGKKCVGEITIKKVKTNMENRD